MTSDLPVEQRSQIFIKIRPRGYGSTEFHFVSDFSNKLTDSGNPNASSAKSKSFLGWLVTANLANVDIKVLSRVKFFHN
jgi:hypothetical protein